MLFNSPLSAQKADRIVESLPSLADEQVIDVGCGEGELLIRVIERKEGKGFGVDQNAECIFNARQAAARRLPENRCEFKEADVQELPFERDSFGLAICLGSTHAFGSGEIAYPNSLRELGRVVRPGGLLLIGEGYWKQEPAREYLELIGEPVGIYRDHAANLSYAEQQGLVPLLALTSSADEWDEFEWTHQRKMELEAASHPNDTEMATKLARRRDWMRGYLQWGRSTMGFGFYLLQRPLEGQNKRMESNGCPPQVER